VTSDNRNRRGSADACELGRMRLRLKRDRLTLASPTREILLACRAGKPARAIAGREPEAAGLPNTTDPPISRRTDLKVVTQSDLEQVPPS
jgi:hypothetical protein